MDSRLLSTAALWVRHLPVVRCPVCKGAGGQMCGYLEPEWDECWNCWPSWEGLDDFGFDRFVGRCSPIRALRGRFVIKTGHYGPIGWLSCKCGLHRRDEEGYCPRCFKVVRRG